MRSFLKVLLKVLLCVLVALVALLSVLTLTAGPAVVRWVNGSGPELIGREVHIEDASLNLFTGQLRLDSLRIAEADGVTTFLSIHEVQARLSMLRLLTGTASLHDVDVDQLRVHVEQRDTVFNFSDILAFLAASDDDEPLPVVMHRVNIRNSSIHYQDLLVRSDFRINDISLFIPGIDLRDLGNSVPEQLSSSLRLDDGGAFDTQVDVDHQRQTYRVSLRLTDFGLHALLPYLRQQADLGSLDGTLDVALDLSGSLRHILDFSVRGTMGVRRFGVFDPDGQALVQCDTVSLGLRSVNLQQNRIELTHLTFDRPSIHVVYGKDSLDNFSRLLVAQPVSADDAAADEAVEAEPTVTFNGREQSLRLQIDRFAIQDATITYHDGSLRAEPFDYQLSAVNVLAPSFTLTGINRITVNARLGGSGSLRLQYEGRLSDQRNMRCSLAADDIAFADFSPYTVQMFGNEVTGGTLSLHVDAQTAAGQLSGQSRLLLTDPKVEKKRRGIDPEMNIPFRTGMYLLTDRNNVCDVRFPIRGSLDEPRFSYKRLIFTTLGKLLVKVVTSPFSSRSELGGDDGSASDVIQLDNGSLDGVSLDAIPSEAFRDE